MVLWMTSEEMKKSTQYAFNVVLQRAGSMMLSDLLVFVPIVCKRIVFVFIYLYDPHKLCVRVFVVKMKYLRDEATHHHTFLRFRSLLICREYAEAVEGKQEHREVIAWSFTRSVS